MHGSKLCITEHTGFLTYMYANNFCDEFSGTLDRGEVRNDR